MTAEPSPYPVHAGDAAPLKECLARLVCFGYTETAVCKQLGLADINDLQMRCLPIYRKENLRERRPLDLAIDLFLLQGTLQARETRQLFTPSDQEVLSRTGILVIDETGAAQATVSLFPAGNRLFFSDHAWPQLSQAPGSAVPFGQVMFVGTDSRWLARATLRKPVAKALDLCTGSGIHALLAASHAKQVVAVDINPRAALCTRFNALASGCNNLEVKVGDLYAPVGRERFDLITANPPFVPSPVNTLGYRDGGPSGEDVQRRIVAGLAEYLAPNGTAQIVTEVGESDAVSVADRVRGWLGSAAMDIHVLKLRIHPAAVYAVGHAAGDDYHALLRSVDDWATNLKNQEYTRVVSVLLTFQWSDPALGLPWDRVDEAYPPKRDCGSEIEALFAAERIARKPGLRAKLGQSRLIRTGPVLLQESRILGSELPSTCQGILSGQALPVEYSLDSIERDLLATLEVPVDVPTLLKIAGQIDINESALMTSLISLLRKGLIKLADS